MLTKTITIHDNVLVIPGMERYKGKLVEVIVREKSIDTGKKKKLEKFLSLCGKVSIDSSEIEKLREASLI